MFQERTKKPISPLEGATMTARRFGQIDQIEDHFVRPGVGFHIAPDVFHGIQLRSIRGKELRAPGRLFRKIRLNGSASVGRESVPQQDAWPSDVAMEMAKKELDPGGVDIGVGIKTEEQSDSIPAGANNQCGDRGQFPVGVGPLAKDGRLPLGGPGAAHQGRQQEAALVEEDQRGSKP